MPEKAVMGLPWASTKFRFMPFSQPISVHETPVLPHAIVVRVSRASTADRIILGDIFGLGLLGVWFSVVRWIPNVGVECKGGDGLGGLRCGGLGGLMCGGERGISLFSSHRRGRCGCGSWRRRRRVF